MTLYSKVEITDLDNNTYTLGKENRGYQVTLHQNKAHVFKLQVADPRDTFKDKYIVGGEVTVYCDSSNPPTTKIFNGTIENVVRTDIYGTRILTIEATEKFLVQTLGILVTDRFSTKKTGWIVRTLISNYTPSFSITNIQDTDTTVNSITFKRRPLKQCLDRLAEISGAIYYCTAEGDVHFHTKETIESGLSLTDTMLKPIPVVTKNLTGLYTIVEVHGGVSLDLDQSQQTYSGGSVSLHDRDIAAKFTPSKIFTRYLELYLDTLGTPDQPLTGRIVEDSSGQPTGPARAFFTYGEAEFTAAEWHGVKLEFDIDPAKSYWIVLNRGGDASNCYRWYHDGSSTGTHSEKTNGSWSVYEGISWTPAFKLYGGDPVIGKAVDSTGYALYGRREYIVEREDITHKEDAVRIASQILAEKSRVKLEFEKLRVRGDQLTALPQPGHLVNLALSPLNFDDKVVIEDIEITFPAGSETVEEVVFTVGEDPESLSRVLQTIEEKIEDEKRKTIRDDVMLNLIELFQESFLLIDGVTASKPEDVKHPVLTESVSFSDDISYTTQNTGTFIVGTGQVDYSDCG